MSQPESRGPPPSRRAMLAWAFYDWANSSFPTVIQTFLFAAYFTRSVAENETSGTTQWGLTVSAAAVVVAISSPLLGATADQHGRRKPWIALFTAACVCATALLWFIKPSPDYVWAALALVAIGTIGAETAETLYNAMLPDLAPADRLGRWSGWGWALGYGGGLACLAAALALCMGNSGLDANPHEAQNVRAAFLLTAGWYAVFSLPFFRWTPDTPATGKALSHAVRDGLRQLMVSLRRVREYSPIAQFLVARMIYIDGLTTLFTFGGVYAAGTFGLDEREVLLFGIALNVTSGLGALAFAWVDDWIGGKRTILLSLTGLLLCGATILLVEAPWLFWTFGCALGIFVGPVQAASRSFLARIAPQPIQNQVFGLFAFSGKATSFVGPLLVSLITWASGSQRIGMTAVLGLLAIGFAVLWTTPERKLH